MSGARPGISSKNSATGPVASHVFETPGTYTVTLTVFNGVSTSTTSTVITVDNPNVVFSGTNTTCVSATAPSPAAGSGGCPSGAAVAIQPIWPTAINTYAKAGKRLLFKRGDSFTADATTAQITGNGPGIVGAYGTGNAPYVQMTAINKRFLTFSNYRNTTQKDWRVMDMVWDGQSQSGSAGVGSEGGIDQLLVLNMNIQKVIIGVGLDGGLIDLQYRSGVTTAHMFEEFALVGSTITPINISGAGWRAYVSSTHGTIQGNTLGNILDNSSYGSHVVRITYMEKGVIENNTLARPGTNQLSLKLHSEAWCESTSPAGTCKSYDTDAGKAGKRR